MAEDTEKAATAKRGECEVRRWCKRAAVGKNTPLATPPPHWRKICRLEKEVSNDDRHRKGPGLHEVFELSRG